MPRALPPCTLVWHRAHLQHKAGLLGASVASRKVGLVVLLGQARLGQGGAVEGQEHKAAQSQGAHSAACGPGMCAKACREKRCALTACTQLAIFLATNPNSSCTETYKQR